MVQNALHFASKRSLFWCKTQAILHQNAAYFAVKTQGYKHKNAQKLGYYAFSFRLKTGVLHGKNPLINGFLGAKSR